MQTYTFIVKVIYSCIVISNKEKEIYKLGKVERNCQVEEKVLEFI